MSATTALDLLAAIVAATKAKLPSLRECESHPGRFDLDELKRFLTRAPSVKVAILRMENITPTGDEFDVALSDVPEDEGSTDVTLRVAAFIVTADEPKLPKETAGLTIATAIAILAQGNAWGLGGAHPADEVRADNLHSTGLDREGVMIWSVSWRQTIRVAGTAAGIEVPEHLYVSMSPDIGAEHRDDYANIVTGEAPPDAG